MTLTEARRIGYLFEESNGVLTEGIMDNIKNSIKKRFSKKDTEEIKQSLSDNLGIDENSSVEEIEEKLREETGGKDNFGLLKKVLKEVAGFGAMMLTWEIQAMIGAGIIKFFDYSPIAIAAVVIYTIYSLSENWEKIRRKGLGKKLDQFIFGKSSHLGDYDDENKNEKEMNESRKKVIRLTESDLARIIKRIIQEGNIDKSSKEKDLDVKMENFRDKIRDFLKSKDCKVKQVGTDFEVHCDGEHVGQVMFRRNAITVKKEGSRFGKDFKFNEMGEIKSELTKMLKKQIKEGGYQGIKNDLGYETGIHNIGEAIITGIVKVGGAIMRLNSIIKGDSYYFNKIGVSEKLLRKFNNTFKKLKALKKLISLFEEKDMKISKGDLVDYGFDIEELLSDLQERYDEIDELKNIVDDEDLIIDLEEYEKSLNDIVDLLYEIPD